MSIFDAIVAELLGSNTGFLFAGLILTAAIVRRVSPDEQRRVRVLSLLFGGHLVLAITAGALAGTETPGYAAVRFVSVALAALAGVGMVVSVAFQVAARRLRLPIAPIVRDVIGVAAYAVVMIVVASRAGINVAGLVATSAVLTAVIGLSLQDTLGNLIAGLTLQSDTAIRLGEWVQIGDVQGRVVEMRWRFTALETRDGETLVVPNAVLVKDKLRVLGRRQGKPLAWRRWIRFRVDHRFRHADVIEAVTAAFRGVPLPPGVLPDQPIDCMVTGFELGLVEYALRYWLADPAVDLPVDSEVRRRVTSALARAGITHASPVERRVMLAEDQLVERQGSSDLDRRLRALGRIAVLGTLEPEQQRTLARQMRDAPFEAGEVLFRQGDRPDGAYVIDEGEVSIRLPDHHGGEREIARLGPGDVVGEMGVMTGEPRTATATAVSAVRTYGLMPQSLEGLIRSRPEIAEALARILAERRLAQTRARAELDADVHTLEQHESVRLLASIRAFFGLDIDRPS